MQTLKHFLRKKSRYTLEEKISENEIKKSFELYESIPNDINNLIKYFPQCDPFNIYITEFLDSLDLNKAGDIIINNEYIQKISISGFIDDYSETIQLKLKENPINDIKFLRIIDVINYEIKTIDKIKDKEFNVIIEKTYPKKSKDIVEYGYHICRNKKIRDNILNSGLRIKYNGFGPKNKYEDKWSKIYFIGDCDIDKLKVTISHTRALLRCTKKDSPVIRFKLPKNANIYKDKTMDDLDNCYFMYCSVPPKYIENTSL